MLIKGKHFFLCSCIVFKYLDSICSYVKRLRINQFESNTWAIFTSQRLRSAPLYPWDWRGVDCKVLASGLCAS